MISNQQYHQTDLTNVTSRLVFNYPRLCSKYYPSPMSLQTFDINKADKSTISPYDIDENGDFAIKEKDLYAFTNPVSSRSSKSTADPRPSFSIKKENPEKQQHRKLKKDRKSKDNTAQKSSISKRSKTSSGKQRSLKQIGQSIVTKKSVYFSL